MGYSTHPFLSSATVDHIDAGEECGGEYADGQITGDERNGVYHVLFPTPSGPIGACTGACICTSILAAGSLRA
jgi:hypothetical protein